MEPVGRGAADSGITPSGRSCVKHPCRGRDRTGGTRPHAEPAGTVRAGGFVTAVRKALMPVAAKLADNHPNVKVVVNDYEPTEAVALLAAGDVDLALTYEYNRAPASIDAVIGSIPLWSTLEPARTRARGGNRAGLRPWRFSMPSVATTGSATHRSGTRRGVAWPPQSLVLFHLSGTSGSISAPRK